LGEASLPALFGYLHAADSRICANAQCGLEAVSAPWESSDARTIDLANRLDAMVGQLDGPGQGAALAVLSALVGRAPVEPSSIPLLTAAAHALARMSAATKSEPQPAALSLAGALLERTGQPEIVEACRNLVTICLRGAKVDDRVLAIRLALRPGMDVLDQVVPLLQDPSAEVRRAALLAVGPSDELIGTDDLLQWLHDPDEEVRELCEQALRGRGLQDGHLRLGRLMTDRRPAIRLQVLESLAGIDDLEPGVWLRRLSHDPAPAVRAAAIRTASEQKTVDLDDRLKQMAQDDPCPTVRQLAQFYLLHARAAAEETEGRR
jgi:HEAT repeat protein